MPSWFDKYFFVRNTTLRVVIFFVSFITAAVVYANLRYKFTSEYGSLAGMAMALIGYLTILVSISLLISGGYNVVRVILRRK